MKKGERIHRGPFIVLVVLAAEMGIGQEEETIARLKNLLGTYPDFPQKGIIFKDILPLFHSPEAFQSLLRLLVGHIRSLKEQPTILIGLDARGFLFGPSLALQLGIPFVPVRKANKLPGELHTVTYEKEYGSDVFAMQKHAIRQGDKVLVVDDIIATGGSARAAGQLVEMTGAMVVEYIFLLELEFLHGRDSLNAPVFTLLMD